MFSFTIKEMIMEPLVNTLCYGKLHWKRFLRRKLVQFGKMKQLLETAHNEG